MKPVREENENDFVSISQFGKTIHNLGSNNLKLMNFLKEEMEEMIKCLLRDSRNH